MNINSLKAILLCLLLLVIGGSFCLAETIIINPNTLIDKDTVYQNVVLDLNSGSFIITRNGSLKIENSKINGTLSPNNPFLISLVSGHLILKKNTVNLATPEINEHPNNPALYYAIHVQQGEIDITNNKFMIDKPYSAALLTTHSAATSNLTIKGNSLNKLHGGVLLRNSNHALIADNTFSNVSGSNIFIIEGNNNLIQKNTILFPGNNNVGDSIDVLNSDYITISQNYISSDSCYSIVIVGSKNILVDHNKITSGITYALYITPSMAQLRHSQNYFFSLLGKAFLNSKSNKNITITNNYFSQNRYGLAGKDIDGLVVKNNIFIQRFQNSASRKFWTNNDLLLQNVINITWDNNFYKEAYTQDISGSNQQSVKIIPFPLHGGVTL